MAKTLYIMRGIPGSGKSTMAKQIASLHNGLICSADDYFMHDGFYQFDQKQLGAAHLACYHKAKSAMETGIKCIIIDNTNTKKWQMQPYEIAAGQHGYTVRYIEMPMIPVDEAFKRNVHHVPFEVIQRMISDYESL
jgi:predicted kinase